MKSILIILLSIWLSKDLFATVSSQTQCVPLKSCPLLLEMLQQQPLTPETIKFLRSSTCGYEGSQPKVQCKVTPNVRVCTTPDGKKGACMVARKCQPFIELLQSSNLGDSNVKEKLRKYQCENNGKDAEVCCEIKEKSPLIITPTTPTTTRRITPPTIIPNFPSHLPRSSANQCGIQNLINKIHGGTQAELDEFPWTVLLQYNKKGQKALLCGGSLISNRYVATAAHCVDRNAVRAYGNIDAVVLGEWDTENKIDCITYPTYKDCADPSYTVDVEEIKVHPQWEAVPGEVNHDLALIRLTKSVNYTEYVKPICLAPPSLDLRVGEEMHLAGWGQTETAKFSNIKLKTTVPITSRVDCILQYRQRGISVGLGMVCAGGVEGQDSCRGDSGGPLMIPIEMNGRHIWFLAGVVSFGPTPCGTVNHSALYTEVSQYLDWIYSTTRP